jgi:hypothetical protein
MIDRLGVPLFLLCATAVLSPAQDLRHGLVDADVVAVARQVGKRAASDDVDLHRLQVIERIRGLDDATTAVTVIDWPRLSLHNRPSPRQSRLYCLHDATREAQRIGLPADQGPYYRMSGRAGSNPLVGAEPAADPQVRFALVLAAADRGVTPAVTAAALVAMALGDDPVARLEATRHLAEQPLLRPHLSAMQWSSVLGRASAESADIDYKIALAELCSEQRLPGIVEALIVGLDTVHDPVYARTVGRLCAFQDGDAAVPPLLQRLRAARDQGDRTALLLAIGATHTGPALEALLQLKRIDSTDAAIDAALREHGSRVARDAALHGGK